MGTAITETVTKHNLPTAAVNELVKIHTQAIEQATRSLQESGDKLWSDTQTEWQTAAKADEEIGGKNDPTKLQETLQTIGKVLDDKRYGGPEVKAALKITGAGNHPEVIRALYRMAKALTEGSFVSGNPVADQTKRSYAERIYQQPKKS
jgi:thiamine pyrophosphate-dependent acetolactate synthase large subunit-like protein